MLYVVLALVLAAFGMLIAALTTANTIWAWISVTVSVVAAALLVLDWLGGRRRAAQAGPAAEPQRPLTEPTESRPEISEPPRDEPTRTGPPAAILAEPVDRPVERPAEPPAGPPVEPPAREPVRQSAPAEEQGEPAEEPTDASDLLVVSDLRVEIRVVDEHPRYHLATCAWLVDKPTLPLPVAEARQLGFTPCARCGPDATLAAEHRAAR